MNSKARLTKLVIEQFGDEQEFMESAAQDIANHGADSGWSGFTYHSETVPFGEKIRAITKPMLEEYADEFGEPDMFAMMANWKYLKEYSPGEIADGWYSNDDEDLHTVVMNSLAWFALEEVARWVSEGSEYGQNPAARKKNPVNHLGEKEYRTYRAWRAACKKADKSVRFDGSSAICNALPDVGEWDGEKGVVYIHHSRKSNPRPRIGAERVMRKSERTKSAPSKRLVARRKANVRKGYYPNPIEGGKLSEADQFRAKARYMVQVSSDGGKTWSTIALIHNAESARDYGKRLAQRSKGMAIRVMSE